MRPGGKKQMKYLRAIIAGVMVALLVACGQEQAEIPVPEVPTSPNAAYKTEFPNLGSTEVTIIGSPAPAAATQEAGSEALLEGTPTAVSFEEVTPEPESITVEPAEETTATPDN
jgi:ABC-type glycerol-3-phosphate transport system substrate-binding protein